MSLGIRRAPADDGDDDAMMLLLLRAEDSGREAAINTDRGSIENFEAAEVMYAILSVLFLFVSAEEIDLVTCNWSGELDLGNWIKRDEREK